MKVTQEQLVELLADTEVRQELDEIMMPCHTQGCCGECLNGQLELLDRPYGQGHSFCSPLPKNLLELCRKGIMTTEFNNNRWEVVKVIS